MTTTDTRFDENSGAWLSQEEVDRFELMVEAFRGNNAQIFASDVAVVFGAGGGGIGAFLRHRARVTSLILVEHRQDKLEDLNRSFRGSRGLTMIDSDPVEAMSDVIHRYAPTVVLLDLHGREVHPLVIRALAQPNPSIEALWVFYGSHGEQQQGLDEMLRMWHDVPFSVENVLDPIKVYAR